LKKEKLLKKQKKTKKKISINKPELNYKLT